MKGGGLLEVLLVNAEGIRHTNIVGRPAYYVIMQCGSQMYTSKVSKGKDNQAWWNEKFTFEFPISDWKRLAHVKLKIMDKELFAESGFVGETLILLGGIVTEGCDMGLIEVKPSPYNVVLEDDTYKGQVKIGFKFMTNKQSSVEVKRFTERDNEPRHSVLDSILRLWENSWWRFLFHGSRNSKNKAT
ncbi:elicitor-responsive protein 3 [Rutidosis leptorrhynchoides]|uniref:elicitor-responsive protein 3 n=1 Tax=Rutidosis leptorrhynchoides TaxID=125765 RepID=UPI003A9A0694